MRALLRSTVRPWAGRPLLAVAIAVGLGLAMALGIAMTAVLEAVADQALVYPHGVDIVRTTGAPEVGKPAAAETLPVTGFVEWRTTTRGFQDLAAWQHGRAVVTAGSIAEARQPFARVSGNLWATLGVPPVAGRSFSVTDEAPSGSAMVTQAFATRAFGAAAMAIGQPLRLDDRAYRIVGVVSDRFAFPAPDVQVYVPLPRGADVRRSPEGRVSVSIAQVSVLGRPHAGVARDMIVAEAGRRFGGAVRVESLRDSVSRAYRRTLEILSIAGALVLAVAAFNIAAVMAAHALMRTTEWAIKGALGASRRALWRDAVRESAALCLAGLVLGGILGAAILAGLRQAGPIELRFVTLSWTTVLQWLGVTLALVGLTSIPAWWQASQLSLAGVGGFSTRTAGDTRSRAARVLAPGLLIAQVAVSIGLVAVALLFSTTLHDALTADHGFDADDVVMVPTRRAASVAPAVFHAQLDTVRQALTTTLTTMDGRGRVSLAADLPILPFARTLSLASREGDSGSVLHGDEGSARLAVVGPAYVDVMGIPLIAGRDFVEADVAGSAGAAIVSRTLATSRFGSPAAALGRTLRVGSLLPAPATIVGVVGDVRRTAWADDDLPVIYVDYRQVDAKARTTDPGSQMVLLVRPPASTPAPAGQEARRITETIRRVQPDLPVAAPRTVREARLDELSSTTLYLVMAALFAVVTTALIALGVFAVVSNQVDRRRVELAIRQSAGATPAQARRAVLGTLATWGICGAILGALLAAGGLRFAAAMQANLAPVTVTIVAGSVAIIMVTVGLAALIPLRRAARVDPGILLRMG